MRTNTGGRVISSRCALLAAVSVVVLSATSARADSYTAGSLIIPMDTSSQDTGMLKAYGLVYRLLQNRVPVEWIISPTKVQGGVDFSVQADNVKTGAHLGTVSYRGGPFVVPQPYRDQAKAIIAAWQLANPSVVAHEATKDFNAPLAQHLVAAPNISVFADGAELIAFGYLNAAGIPQSNGAAWPTVQDTTAAYPGQPDILSEAELSGPTTTNHADGALLDPNGYPTYCHILSMHVNGLGNGFEAVQEVRSYLGKAGTQYVGTCKSGSTFNNNANGRILTSGPVTADNQPATVTVPMPSSPYIQFDGTWGTVPGEPSYKENSKYAATDVLLKGTGSAAGAQEVVFSGFLDGNRSLGHALWLGGHQYTTTTPISTNPTTQGVRVILNGLLASPCSSASTQPSLTMGMTGPAFTTTAQATYTISWTNKGQWPARAAVVSYTLPVGVTFVSATGGGTLSGSTVSWAVGNVNPGVTTSVTVTVNLGLGGTTTHQASMAYSAGTTTYAMQTNTVTTWFFTGPQPMVADWIYTEPNGRITDGLAVADLDSTVVGSELVVVAPTKGASGPGRTIVLRSDIGKELSSFSPGTGRNVMGLPVADDLVAGGVKELSVGEPLPVTSNAAAFVRGSASAGVWTSLPYGYASYWNMGQSAAEIVASSAGMELVVADWDGHVRTLSGATGAVLSAYNAWTTDGDHPFGHVALADVDGDGQLEAITAGYVKGLVTVLNPEVGPTMTKQWQSASLKALYGDSPYGSGPAVGDIDGDGKPELVVMTYGANSDVYAFDPTMASGSSCEHRFHPGGLSVYSSPVIGDVDGSGRKSIVSMRASTGTVVVMQAGAKGCTTAGGTIAWQHTIKAGDWSSFAPVLYDVNGDGALDVIAATNTRLEVIDVKNRAVLLYFEDPTGVFGPSAVVANADPASNVRELYVTGWYNSKVYRLRLPVTATATSEWPSFMGGSNRAGAR